MLLSETSKPADFKYLLMLKEEKTEPILSAVACLSKPPTAANSLLCLKTALSYYFPMGKCFVKYRKLFSYGEIFIKASTL